MKIFDLLQMCVKNLVRRKFRTFLTVMGVTIGTCSIVVMISLGLGISKNQNDWINSMGDLTIIQVYGGWGGADSGILNDDAIAQIQMMEETEVATPFQQFYDIQISLHAGKKGRYVMEDVWNLTGIYPEALEKLGYNTTEGSMLPDASSKRVYMIFGSDVAYSFRDTKKRYPNDYVYSWPDELTGEISDPFFKPLETDMTLKVKSYDSTAKEVEYEAVVSGIIGGGGSREYETRSVIYMDISELRRIKAEYQKANNIKPDKNQVEQYDDVRVKAKSLADVVPLAEKIEEMGFQTWSMESMRQEAENQSRQLQLILGALGGVSLFVAAISITNTMIMSVYERTREIGVMKVLGCLVSNIRTIFLVEAGMIGFFGGVVGIGISYLLSFLMNRFGGNLGNMLGFGMMGGGEDSAAISIIPLWLVLLGLTFATLIGLVSGFYPANRAVRISALEAIKQE